jgi:methylase of polypeptide subunit release factors
MATDMSQDALNLAQENLALLKKPLHKSPRFLRGDLFVPVIRHFGKKSPETILITANLPYVLSREVVGDLIYEPKMAFIGGEKTGFELYERFFRQLASWKSRPKTCHIVIEF